MNLRPLALVYGKELRELRRDLRTILSMIVAPVVLAPVIIVSVLHVAKAVMKEAPKVMLLGGQGSPDIVAALRELKNFNFVPARPDYTNLIASKAICAAVDIPDDFDAAVAAERKTTLRIYTYEAEPKSMQAAQQLEEFFRHRREEVVRRRLLQRALPATLVTPYEVRRANVASPRQVSGIVVGMILPYLMIIMCLTGAIYPSVDLTAGEKERGTLETLLCSPVARTHLALGKMLVVLTTSLAAAALSLCSNGVALAFIHAGRFARIPLAPDPLALAAVGVLMLPLAVFLASLTVAVGLFARSSKEANTYLQPLLILALIPAVVAALPGVDFNYRFAFVPVLNMSLLCKELLSGTCHWGHVMVVFGSMTGYAALAVAAAVAMFNRESVLFRT